MVATATADIPISVERMHFLIDELAKAKSAQNIDEALNNYHQDIELISPNINSYLKGQNAVRDGLIQFFELFPDYNVRLTKFAHNQGLMFASGTVSATPNVEGLASIDSVQRFEVPVIIEFYFQDDRIQKEVFHFDMNLAFEKAGVCFEGFNLFNQ